MTIALIFSKDILRFGKEFDGGLFHFQDADPTTIMPVAGDAIIYSADSSNIHSVDEITNGERLTLTMWFTRDNAHDEDAKLLPLLAQIKEQNDQSQACLPVPGPSNMYWYYDYNSSSAIDIRWARIHILGFDIYNEKLCHFSDPDFDPTELHNGPLMLARGEELCEIMFSNSLHALQVVQFYCWKVPCLKNHGYVKHQYIRKTLRSQKEKSNCLSFSYSERQDLAGKVFGYSSCEKESRFLWDDFLVAISMWEEYVQVLRRRLMSSISQWLENQSLCLVDME